MLLCMLLLLVPSLPGALADVFRPAYLELRELGEDRYALTWKVPAQGPDVRLAAYVVLPPGTETLSEPHAAYAAGSWTERYEIRHPGGLVGETIRIDGRAVGVTDVIARIERRDGSSQVERLPMDVPQFVVAAPAGTAAVAWTYLLLGVEHILAGLDHLLFVLALLLVVRGVRRIVATITAFTVAHSVTLVAASLGWVHMPGPPVEAVIALSIVFVASEVLHGLEGRPGLTARAPWIVAFSFGLLHGLGFAGALAEIGLPQDAVPVALLMFNVGVEVGQLLFVAAVLTLRWIAGSLLALPPALVPRVAAYGIGTLAAFWTVERVAAFF
ncbi:MAG TPA: HupE/UreJ family protein [Woeseiaceae bacterium]|nr:HupE/UreJ family protein [Woeseiaceae bacterium]